MNTAQAVRLRKEKHPEKYCPEPGCLWRTDGQYCPRHHVHNRYKTDARDYGCDVCLGDMEE